MIADALPVVTVALLAAAVLLTRGLRRSRRRQRETRAIADGWRAESRGLQRHALDLNARLRALAEDNLSLWQELQVTESVARLQFSLALSRKEKIEFLELQLEAQRVLTEAPR